MMQRVATTVSQNVGGHDRWRWDILSALEKSVWGSVKQDKVFDTMSAGSADQVLFVRFHLQTNFWVWFIGHRKHKKVRYKNLTNR